MVCLVGFGGSLLWSWPRVCSGRSEFESWTTAGWMALAPNFSMVVLGRLFLLLPPGPFRGGNHLAFWRALVRK